MGGMGKMRKKHSSRIIRVKNLEEAMISLKNFRKKGYRKTGDLIDLNNRMFVLRKKGSTIYLKFKEEYFKD